MNFDRIAPILVGVSLGITADAGAAAPGDTERALLRLEERAGQSHVVENAVIGEMVDRLENMGRTIAELQRLIAALPSPPGRQPAPACPTEAETLADEPPGLSWLPIAGGAGLLVLFGLLGRRWRQRRRDSTVAKGKTVIPPQGTRQSDHEAAEAKLSVPAGPVLTPPAGSRKQVAAPPMAASATLPDSGAVTPPACDTVADNDLSLELADVMLSLGLSAGATQTLSEHVRLDPRNALDHWLKLLEIYRSSDMQAEFERAAREMRKYFNIAPPAWQLPDPSAKVPELESYAHIRSRIEELWPRHSCAEYLKRLIEDNRGGTRTGFPQPVIEEILFLLSILRG